jgi:hypothetical protein
VKSHDALSILFGEHVLSIARLCLKTQMAGGELVDLLLDDSLLLICANGKRFEFYRHRNGTVFVEPSALSGIPPVGDYDLYLEEHPTRLRKGEWLQEILQAGSMRPVWSYDGDATYYVAESYELDPDIEEERRFFEQPIADPALFTPGVVSSIREVWLDEGEKQWLASVTLYTSEGVQIVCAYFVNDALDILSEERHRFETYDLPWTFRVVLHRWYATRR